MSALGVSLAAYEMPPVRITRKLAQPVAAGPAASVWGSLARTTPDAAAFVNSAMVRCLDMSDTYVMSAVSHPADAFSAVLAVAEAEKLSGRDLLLATALIYETQCRFVEVVPYNHHGWDQTPAVALGAAVGCARLLGIGQHRPNLLFGTQHAHAKFGLIQGIGGAPMVTQPLGRQTLEGGAGEPQIL